ncbi:MAG: acyl-CoA dehydrogenase family protein [Hyphomicrobiales bacterium]|nr:acyl-CoA dehydrogenase family protein [Hyphomicrobiales bacterium]
MDFALTPEQIATRATIDAWMSDKFPPEEVRRFDQAHEMPTHLLAGFGELGLLGAPFPERFGGSEADWITVTAIQERLGYHSAVAAAIYSITVDFGGMSLMTYGNDEQRERLMPDLVAGRSGFALALTESTAGTDAAAMRTSASPVEGGWRINGRKTWISCADAAQWLVTPCRSRRGSVGREGISIFMVPRHAPGIHMTKLPKIGNQSMTSWDIAFDDVFVEQANLMGPQDDGFRCLMSTLGYSRAGQAANAIGQAQAAVDMTLSHLRERHQFGAPLSQFQVLRHRAADMQMRVDQARLMLYRLAWMIGRGDRCRKESAQAKILASEALQYVTHHGMQILASTGYAAESDMNRYWRDGRLYTFGEGANEMLRDLIAREMGL